MPIPDKVHVWLFWADVLFPNGDNPFFLVNVSLFHLKLFPACTPFGWKLPACHVVLTRAVLKKMITILFLAHEKKKKEQTCNFTIIVKFMVIIYTIFFPFWYLIITFLLSE